MGLARTRDDLWKSIKTTHFNDLWMKFYDYDLNSHVAYARHAISIDENRANFQRVPWYSVKQTSRDERGLQWFEQVWFSGVHADVGGGYPENELRHLTLRSIGRCNGLASSPEVLSTIQLY